MEVHEMKTRFCMMIIVFGFSTIFQLHLMASAVTVKPVVLDPVGQTMKNEWEDLKAHPPLNRTTAETKFLTEYLSQPVMIKEGQGPMKSLRRCNREEYRTLSENSRNELHYAFNLLKQTLVTNGTNVNRTEYDVFVGYHRFDVARAAHNGPAFLVWHREFLLRLERALRQHRPNVCLPYVDWTLDQGIPVPGDSAIWTSKYLGNNYGVVKSGLAANWQAYPQDCRRRWPTLYRTVVSDSSGKNYLYTDAEIDRILANTRYQDICAPYNYGFERNHNSAHVYVGGHMSMLACAPNDPVFFMHHCFVDYLFQEFRKKHQKSDLETEYPSDWTVPSNHEADDPMRPFENLHNIDGLNKTYTQLFFTYRERPHKCTEQKDCRSNILWCNKATGRCLAKIREGGRCDKLPNEACYGETCKVPINVNGTCKCP